MIHPFSGSPGKNWPLDSFRQVAALLEANGLPVQWCAGPDEPLDNAVRFDDLGSLAAWLATADVFIGNDSGISHLAAACGAPVVAIFGPTDPRIWAPRGEHVQIMCFEDDPLTVARAALRVQNKTNSTNNHAEPARLSGGLEVLIDQ